LPLALWAANIHTSSYPVRLKGMVMPLYEYQCRKCQHQFEVLILKSSLAPLCPACSGSDLEQLISRCAVSSEASRQASLATAHRRAAAVRNEKHRESHTHLHEHFEDSSTKPAD
jgi:putative FmdB family regulatory protein